MSQMALLACGLLLGFVLRRVKIMNDDVIHGMTRLVIDVTMPCMIIAAVITRDSLPDVGTIGMIFACAWGMYALVLAVAFIVPYVFRLDKSKFGTYRFMTVFGNTGFLGFPLCAAIFGQQSVLYASIFNIPFNILCFTIGIMML
ncbi:MAG: AEC family transporter, partial [Coriobacteriaceae bacterium]|nr:AEC family transporter [Coriobacteriaceae bacterium]